MVSVLAPQAEGLCSDSQLQVKITEVACASPQLERRGPGAHRSAVWLNRSVTSRFNESLSKKLRLKVTEGIPPVTSGLCTHVHTCTNVCIPHGHKDRSIHVHRKFPLCLAFTLPFLGIFSLFFWGSHPPYQSIPVLQSLSSP